MKELQSICVCDVGSPIVRFVDTYVIIDIYGIECNYRIPFHWLESGVMRLFEYNSNESHAEISEWRAVVRAEWTFMYCTR